MKTPRELADDTIFAALKSGSVDWDNVPVVELSIADLRVKVARAIAQSNIEVIKAQHEAIDWLMASLIARDKTFMPTQSPVWPAVEQGTCDTSLEQALEREGIVITEAARP
jgi:hypothetical protein